jgi:hypothetical protein
VQIIAPAKLTSQITRVSVLIAAVTLATLLGFGWWVASRIDTDTRAREARAIAGGQSKIRRTAILPKHELH